MAGCLETLHSTDHFFKTVQLPLIPNPTGLNQWSFQTDPPSRDAKEPPCKWERIWSKFGTSKLRPHHPVCLMADFQPPITASEPDKSGSGNSSTAGH
jgi:hypothetical protein